MEFYVEFSRPNDTVDWLPALGPVRLGPYPDFVQLTYETLRVGPDGESIAFTGGGGWTIVAGKDPADPACLQRRWYSDVVIGEATP